MTARNYRDKDVIFSQGDPADALFDIQSGTVKLTMVSTGRKKAILAFPPAHGPAGTNIQISQLMALRGIACAASLGLADLTITGS